MKEQLVSLLTSKVGLDQEKANQTVDTILEYITANPEQLTSYLEKVGLGGVAGTLGGAAGKLGGLLS